MVRNKVNLTTECCGFMNLGCFGFGCDLTAKKKKKTEKSGTTLDAQ